MEFELQYNTVVLNNKNFFYFSNYCNDIEEFKEWLKYNHNNVSIEEYKELDDEYKISIYLDTKRKYIIDMFQKYKDELKNINQLYSNNYRLCTDSKKYLFVQMYEFYLQNKYYIELIKEYSVPMQNIYFFIDSKRGQLERIYTRNIY